MRIGRMACTNKVAHTLVSVGLVCCLALPMSDVSASALASYGGRSQPLPGRLGTIFRVGVLAISLDEVRVATCLRRPHGWLPYRAGTHQEFLLTSWALRNQSNRLFTFPRPTWPGFRLVAGHRLLPGAYRSYPGYPTGLYPHVSVPFVWSFVILRGTRRVWLTYVPPGPRGALWSAPVSPVPATGPCQ
jgi:hypothetical protein